MYAFPTYLYGISPVCTHVYPYSLLESFGPFSRQSISRAVHTGPLCEAAHVGIEAMGFRRIGRIVDRGMPRRALLSDGQSVFVVTSRGTSVKFLVTDLTEY